MDTASGWEEEIKELVFIVNNRKSNHLGLEKLVEKLLDMLNEQEICYFNILLSGSEQEIWELEEVHPDPSDEYLSDTIIDLHETLDGNLWDGEDIVKAMQISHLLTQAPDAETAEQVIDVWMTAYWDGVNLTPEDIANAQHVTDIMNER